MMRVELDMMRMITMVTSGVREPRPTMKDWPKLWKGNGGMKKGAVSVLLLKIIFEGGTCYDTSATTRVYEGGRTSGVTLRQGGGHEGEDCYVN